MNIYMSKAREKGSDIFNTFPFRTQTYVREENKRDK